MKVKVLKNFTDKYTGKKYKAGETIEVTEERFEEILTVDTLVEKVGGEGADKEPKKTPRKSQRKSAK